MNNYYLGIDLGSTTSKAVLINEKDEIIGRGITNTRANYKVAADIAKLEALYDARFTLVTQKLKTEIETKPEFKKYIDDTRAVFQYLQFKHRVDRLTKELLRAAKGFATELIEPVTNHVQRIMATIVPAIKNEFMDGDLGSKNQFFRDIVSEWYNKEVELVEKRCMSPSFLLMTRASPQLKMRWSNLTSGI